jgi:transcriptional regulator MraZ
VAGGGMDRTGAGGGAKPDAHSLFRGVTHLSLDAKGRLAVPSRYRDALAGGEGRLVLTADPSRCLLIYPLAEWEPRQASLMAGPSLNETVRSLQRLLVGHADDVELDGSGRILIPPALGTYASLDKHVVLVGQGHRFELWGHAQWQAQTAKAITLDAGQLPPELSGFSL